MHHLEFASNLHAVLHTVSNTKAHMAMVQCISEVLATRQFGFTVRKEHPAVNSGGVEIV